MALFHDVDLGYAKTEERLVKANQEQVNNTIEMCARRLDDEGKLLEDDAYHAAASLLRAMKL
jgi:hypothetical protein